MNLGEIRKLALSEYYPALFLEAVLPHRKHDVVRKITGYLTIIAFIIGTVLYGIGSRTGEYYYSSQVFGVGSILLAFWMLFAALQAFYYSFYFKGLSDNEKEKPILSFELANILYETSASDPMLSFMKSREGRTVLHRTGISLQDIADFISKRTDVIDSSHLSFPQNAYVSVSDYVGALYDIDRGFSKFLFAHGIQRKDFIAIVEWVVEREIAHKIKARWWSREALYRIPGIGKNWSYGRVNDLEKYLIEIPDVVADEYEVHDVYGSKELGDVENVLVKDRSANAMIVASDRAGALSLVSRLNKMIEVGKALLPLQHKRMLMIDVEQVSAGSKTKADFETIVMSLMNEAVSAGNIILVMPDFASFVNSCEAMGTDVVSLMDPYFSRRDLHIIGITDMDRYHDKIAKNVALMERFEKVQLEEVDVNNTLRVLENEIIPIELSSNLFFTYSALATIADSADRFITEGMMPDKAVNLLHDIIPKIISLGKESVTREDIENVVKVKTGIPVGEMTGVEREKLLSLETILHQRIVGQDEAVDAIANAVRRARSGINNPNRPMASFLFLGPTGVGKTETTKALGEVFFGENAPLLRLDMSEYSSGEALNKLIGSFGGKSGVLTNMLREHPYGVLLLDEFEKTTQEVMNLFLQILDEGVFSDMEGKKVNARNLLIIATSNAGSEMIWDAVKKGENLSHAKDLILDSIISSHVMKPELLNRFDGVVIFHPLDNTHLEKIAKLQLGKLAKRLAERGIELVITPELVTYLMSYGADPKFGARPMNRAIQDRIEQAVAEKMIRGEAKPGSEIRLDTNDLKK